MGERAPMNDLPGADAVDTPRNGFGVAHDADAQAPRDEAPPADGQPGQEAGSEARQPRERRSRDRYGRDRRERGEGDRNAISDGRGDDRERSAESSATAFFAEPNQAPAQEERAQAATNFVAPAAEVVAANNPVAAPTTQAAPVRTAVAPAPAQVPAPASATLPKVQSYDLPMQDLSQVAQSSGLQWVNSNAGKIAEVQAAIAAEARPIHVPRERQAVAASTEGPLVLVETKRDLASMSLPFEKPQA